MGVFLQQGQGNLRILHIAAVCCACTSFFFPAYEDLDPDIAIDFIQQQHRIAEDRQKKWYEQQEAKSKLRRKQVLCAIISLLESSLMCKRLRHLFSTSAFPLHYRQRRHLCFGMQLQALPAFSNSVPQHAVLRVL